VGEEDHSGGEGIDQGPSDLDSVDQDRGLPCHCRSMFSGMQLRICRAYFVPSAAADRAAMTALPFARAERGLGRWSETRTGSPCSGLCGGDPDPHTWSPSAGGPALNAIVEDPGAVALNWSSTDLR
jgi:hypothetical protein